jgi:ABC-type nitrate/sulfonate/bicarbonate transport system ATPase subunit
MGDGIIQVRNLVKSFPPQDTTGEPLRVIRDVDIDIADHEFLCILGPSGCGKSTLLNILSGLDREYTGEIRIDGTPVARDRRPVRISYLFQEDRLLPWRTVERNIDFVLETCKVPRSQRPELKDRYFGLVGLNDFRGHYPHHLSGGMRQRLALVRALCVEPKILLMDEPFSGLDELTARRLRVDLLRIWRETRKTIVFVTHNAYEASFLADRILVMSRGVIAEEIRVNVPRPRDYDDPEVFKVNQKVVKVFLSVADGGAAAPTVPPPRDDDDSAFIREFGTKGMQS